MYIYNDNKIYIFSFCIHSLEEFFFVGELCIYFIGVVFIKDILHRLSNSLILFLKGSSSQLSVLDCNLLVEFFLTSPDFATTRVYNIIFCSFITACYLTQIRTG